MEGVMRKSWWLVGMWCVLGMFYAISAIGGSNFGPFFAFFAGCFAVASVPNRKETK